MIIRFALLLFNREYLWANLLIMIQYSCIMCEHVSACNYASATAWISNAGEEQSIQQTPKETTTLNSDLSGKELCYTEKHNYAFSLN